MNEWKETDYGKVPGHWKIETIGAISEKVTDGSHFSPKPCSTGKYMCSVKDMTYDRFDFSSCKLISHDDFKKLTSQGCAPQKNDILISKDGANCLDLIFVFNQEEDLVLLSSIAIVRLLSNNDSKFIRYFLLSPACQYTMRNNFVTGSAIPRVVLKDFKKVPILLPPLPEQRAIVSVLSSLDDKIDLLHRQNKTLEAMTETLFRQWFVEEADDGWEEKPLSFYGDIVCGKTPSKKIQSYFNGEIPFIKIPDMHSEIFLFGTTDSLTEEGKLSQSNKTLPPMSICVSCIATVGLVSINAKESQTNQQINSIIPNKEFYRYFLYLTMKAYYDLLHSMASGGTATLNLNTSDFSKISVQYPGDILLTNFHKEIESLFDKIFLNQSQIHTLEKLRDTLLPKLMSGEMRVKYEKNN